MNFGKTTKIEPLPLTQDLPGILYPQAGPDGQADAHRDTLCDIVRVLGPVIGTFPAGYTLLVAKEAMDAFLSYADEVYRRSHKEATGLFLGYYVHAPGNPEIRVGIVTTFMEAHGDASKVTCEISHEDSCRAIEYASKHLLLVIAWPHSHPGFGVFYSATDSGTLRRDFCADQHAGIVVDNLQDRYLAYKIIDGRQEKIPLRGFSLQDLRRDGEWAPYEYLEEAPAPATEPGPAGIDGRPDALDDAEIRERLASIEASLTEIKAMLEAQAAKGKDNGRKMVVAGVLGFFVATICYVLTR